VEERFGRTGRSFAAAVATGYAMMTDYVVLIVGTLLFATHIVYNARIIAFREIGKYLQRATHIRGGRYKNIWSPGKSKL
tara:strand:- start:451 stop:687 length:237 start_codon:yes stop_codon:yes gene_type:complete